VAANLGQKWKTRNHVEIATLFPKAGGKILPYWMGFFNENPRWFVSGSARSKYKQPDFA